MSYDIYFIKTKDLNSENVYNLLETTEPKPDNEIFISKDLMKSLTEQIKSEGLKFEVFEGKNEDYFELNFSSYQLSIFNSQIVISLPYWEENSKENINTEIKQITNILLNNGLIGFDPQKEIFLTTTYELQQTFTETTILEDFSFNSKIQNNYGDTMVFLGLGIGILILGFFIWKKVKK